MEICLFRLFHSLINEKSYDKYTNSDEYIEYFVAIHLYFRDKFVFGDNSMESISYGGQYDIPTHGAKSREKNKFGEFHTCQSCRYGNKLTYSRYQSSDEGGYTTMLVEIAFGCFDFFLVEQTDMSDAAVGEFINERTSNPTG